MVLQESERKAYNPRPFCKTYTMDKQPLNTGEQKDMTEFFTDLITKMEEMSQELVKELWDNRSPQTHQAEDGGDVPGPLEQSDVCLLQKNTVKTLFGGVITNNVVSLVSPRAVPLLLDQLDLSSPAGPWRRR